MALAKKIEITEGTSNKGILAGFYQILVQKKGIVFVYAVLGCALALVIAVLASLILNPALIYWVKGAQILLFIRMGMLNESLSKKYLSFLTEKRETYLLLFCCLLTFFICGSLLLFYGIADPNLLIMAFASASAFLMPGLYAYTLHEFESFPEKQYQPWYVDEVTDETVSIFLNSIRIEIQLAKKYFDISDTIYNATVPVQISFGKLFNRFVSEKNRAERNAIELTDSKRKRFGWEFYVEIMGGLSKKHIDPNLTLLENGIKQNARVIAKRISNIKKRQNLLTETASKTNKNR